MSDDILSDRSVKLFMMKAKSIADFVLLPEPLSSSTLELSRRRIAVADDNEAIKVFDYMTGEVYLTCLRSHACSLLINTTVSLSTMLSMFVTFLLHLLTTSHSLFYHGSISLYHRLIADQPSKAVLTGARVIVFCSIDPGNTRYTSINEDVFEATRRT